MSTRPSLPVVAALLLLAAAAPACALAQRTADAAPLPFHPGQWGLSANIFGGEAAGIGALRFTAPNRALVLDVSASMNREKRAYPASPLSPGSSQQATTGSVMLSLGLRHFRPLANSVAFFNTLGVNGNYQGGTGTHGWGAGLFGDVGAQYMLDPRFSLGVAAGLQLGYNEFRYPGGPNGAIATTTSTSLHTTPARFMGAVYF